MTDISSKHADAAMNDYEELAAELERLATPFVSVAVTSERLRRVAAAIRELVAERDAAIEQRAAGLDRHDGDRLANAVRDARVAELELERDALRENLDLLVAERLEQNARIAALDADKARLEVALAILDLHDAGPFRFTGAGSECTACGQGIGMHDANAECPPPAALGDIMDELRILRERDCEHNDSLVSIEKERDAARADLATALAQRDALHREVARLDDYPGRLEASQAELARVTAERDAAIEQRDAAASWSDGWEERSDEIGAENTRLRAENARLRAERDSARADRNVARASHGAACGVRADIHARVARERDALRITLDAIARALHPHWEGDGHTYDPDELPAMVERLMAALQGLRDQFFKAPEG